MMQTWLLRLILILNSNIASRGFIADGRGPWWNILSEDVRLIFTIVLFLVNLIILAVVLYLAGLIVVGKRRALLSDAFIISLLGSVSSALFFMFFSGWLALALSIVVWLLLIKRFFETSWLKAIAIGTLAIIVFLAVTVLLALVFGILYEISERFLYFTTLLF